MKFARRSKGKSGNFELFLSSMEIGLIEATKGEVYRGTRGGTRSKQCHKFFTRNKAKRGTLLVVLAKTSFPRSSLERGIKGPVSTVSVVNSFSDPTRGRNSQFDNYNPMAIEAKHYKRIMFPETTHWKLFLAFNRASFERSIAPFFSRR